ncbi:MAG TPA: hypothetical protein VK138_02195, partial [Acidiferrobacterales bacterium]|nr:hypothetical protein [Acidiferrobacterales bacterium]
MLESYRSKFPLENVAVAFFCLALIGIVLAVTMQRIRFERSETIAAVVKQNSNLAIAFEEHTVRTLKGIDQALQLIKHRYEQEGLKLILHKLVEDGEIDDSIFIGLGVDNEHGKRVLGRDDSKVINVADREFFTFHRQQKNDEMFIGKPALGRITGKWAIHMSRRINKPDGSFGGVVVAAVDPGYFTQFYRQTDLGAQGLVLLVGLDGIGRAKLAGEKGSFGDDWRGSSLLVEQAKGPVGNL